MDRTRERRGRVVRDERPRARAAVHEALTFELAVRLQDGVRVDGEPRYHFPGCRKLVVGLEPSDPDGVLNLLDQLPVSRDPRRPIEMELNHCAMSLVERRKHSDLAPRGQGGISLFGKHQNWAATISGLVPCPYLYMYACGAVGAQPDDRGIGSRSTLRTLSTAVHDLVFIRDET